MKLIKSSSEILEQTPGLEGIYEAIERAGRTCYKSERPEGKTAKDFVDMLIKRGHLSPLEHGTVYLHQHFDGGYRSVTGESYQRYVHNPYSKVNYQFEKKVDESYDYYITTNYRVLLENDWLDDLKYLCEPTEYHEKRVGVRVNCSIGISREWNRHRALATTEDMKSINDLEFSVCEQSTRYCNYSKDKFNNELTFVIPSWVDENKIPKNTIINHDDCGDLINEYYFHLTGKEEPYFKPWKITPEMNFIHSLQISEQLYLELLKQGLIPQEAREVLPLSTATEVVYTGYVSDWSHFFSMRCDKAAHPDIRTIAIPLKEEFIKRDYIK